MSTPHSHLFVVCVSLLLAAGCCRPTHGFRLTGRAEFLSELDWYSITRPSLIAPAGDFVSHAIHQVRWPRREDEAIFHTESVAETSDGLSARRKRSAAADDRRVVDESRHASVERSPRSAAKQEAGTLFIRVPLGAAEYVLELLPNERLISPSIVVERRRGGTDAGSLNPGPAGRRSRSASLPSRSSAAVATGGILDGGDSSSSSRPVQVTASATAGPACHYVGRVRGVAASTVAVSTCEGLTGMIVLNDTHYLIEPLERQGAGDGSAEVAQEHIIYRAPPSALAASSAGKEHKPRGRVQKRSPATVHPACGVSDDNYPRGSDRRRVDTGRAAGRRRKRSTSVERFVEALVVVDPMMMAYYKDEDIETYVFTIMNMVSEMYHYASIGNAINIVVVRLMLLETDEPDLVITHHADNTLNSFCKWQQTVNPDKSSSEHHDVAILLTRRNICSKINEPCSTLGLAQVMGMCQLHRSCNVNEDTGLALAYTVAHELGHNFGMKHDGPGSECPLPANDKVFIMAPEMVTQAGSLLLWSSCSRDAITRFLDRGWGDCLVDEPGGRTRPDYPITPPGVMYDADHQCRLQYGSGARHCFGIEDVCSTLWCRVNNHCVTRLEPAAEGTLCDDADNGTVNGVAVPKKWCFAGKCTAIGERPTAIDGGWAAWSSWSDCTRTCGGGVSGAERQCDNPMPSKGGRYCTGERRRHRICNTQPCPEGAATFREVQCAEHNPHPYRSVLYEWEPVSIPDNPCQLVCKPTTMYFSVTLREVVRDGTPCRTGTKNMCISGICRAVGCDWVIDSDAKEDRCGVCHGDGSTCKTIKDQFKAQEGMGYVEAAVIPEGARNIRVEEVAEANNYLAIRSERGEYYLNGHWFIQWSGDYAAAGTVIHYERNGNKEGITAVGPLREPIHVMLLFQSHNPGVLFEYTVPNENATRRLSFAWKYLDWSHCTVSCGGGLQRSKVVCSEQEAGIVEDIFCKNATKPDDKARTCNVHLCPARWWTGPWQHCSATCGGVTGLRRRTVLCVRSLGPEEQMALDDADCEPLPRPQADEPCQRHLPPCPTPAATAAAAPAMSRAAATTTEAGGGDDGAGAGGDSQPWIEPPARAAPPAASASRPGRVHCSDLCEVPPSAEALACRRESGQCTDADTATLQSNAGLQPCPNVTCGEWRSVGWTECPCEGGEQRSIALCVDGHFCAPSAQPESRSRYCDSGPCDTTAVHHHLKTTAATSAGRSGTGGVGSSSPATAAATPHLGSAEVRPTTTTTASFAAAAPAATSGAASDATGPLDPDGELWANDLWARTQDAPAIVEPWAAAGVDGEGEATQAEEAVASAAAAAASLPAKSLGGAAADERPGEVIAGQASSPTWGGGYSGTSADAAVIAAGDDNDVAVREDDDHDDEIASGRASSPRRAKATEHAAATARSQRVPPQPPATVMSPASQRHPAADDFRLADAGGAPKLVPEAAASEQLGDGLELHDEQAVASAAGVDDAIAAPAEMAAADASALQDVAKQQPARSVYAPLASGPDEAAAAASASPALSAAPSRREGSSLKHDESTADPDAPAASAAAAAAAAAAPPAFTGVESDAAEDPKLPGRRAHSQRPSAPSDRDEEASAAAPPPLPHPDAPATAASARLDSAASGRAALTVPSSALAPSWSWQSSEWTKCSATCGHGWQTRSIWCAGQHHESAAIERSLANCGQELPPPPESQRPCYASCIEWVSGPWSQCSVTCGGGEQIRNVQCINRQTDQTAADCDRRLKPAESQQCGLDKCSSSSAALQEWSGSDCEHNKLASSTCDHLKERGYCLFTYVVKNCCVSCGGGDAAAAAGGRDGS